jgi:hypothetical protein
MAAPKRASCAASAVVMGIGVRFQRRAIGCPL